MHWSDDIVEELAKRGKNHVIGTGTSISGIPHLGNASDVIRGDCIRKALLESGFDVELIWISDDSDPFRKVPKGMDLGDYLGFPVKDIPDLEGCHDNFVDHLAKPFIEDLKSYGVEPRIYSGTDLYRSGAFTEKIRIAFERRDDIRKILNRFRKDPLPENWIPWTPICEKCGSISTTNTSSVDGLFVSYRCEDTDVSGGQARGCGFEGISDASKGRGKLPWRVEWAARWALLNVTCEPFGKDHAGDGASYDTSKVISKEIFDWDAPVPLVYEFFTLNGAKISSSKGNVITLNQWLGIAEPEVLKYFMYKKLAKARDINLEMLPNLVDEYDECERIYFKKQDFDENRARLYELSQVGEPRYLNVPFTFCAVLSQVSSVEDLEKKTLAAGYEGFDLERLKNRVELAGRWVQELGPEYLRFELKTVEDSKVDFSSLGEGMKKVLMQLSDAVATIRDAKLMHKRIYEISRENDIEPKDTFTALYQVLIGKEKGPKAAAFLMSLGTEELEKRFC